MESEDGSMTDAEMSGGMSDAEKTANRDTNKQCEVASGSREKMQDDLEQR